jgi:hypothetical protein
MNKTTLSRASSQSGQIGIIIILIMVVLLTIGLSLASRSTSEIALSQQEEESTRVFNAAENGIETALSSSLTFSGDNFSSTPSAVTGDDANLSYSITKVHNLETRISEGVSARVQLNDATYSTPAGITIDWARETNCSPSNPASLLVSIYTIDTTVVPNTTTVRHYAYAACNHSDGITVSGTGGSGGYFKRVTIALNAKDTLVRIKPVYSDTYVKVAPTVGNFPVQYYNIRSTASNQRGNETRIVSLNRTLPTAPSIFDYVLFSGTTLVK